MRNKSTKKAEYEEQFELLTWLITTLDNRRASLESRAAMVLSITALLFGGLIFLMDTTFSQIQELELVEKGLFIVSFGASFLFLIISITTSTAAIANIRRTSRQTYGKDMPKRLFFYPRETFDACKDFADFQEEFAATGKAQMTTYMLGELWILLKEYHSRYQRFRLAIRFLLIAVIPLLLSTVLFLGRYF